MMAEQLVNANTWPEFDFVDDILKYKNKIVIGSHGELRGRLVGAARDPYIRGHARVQNFDKRLNALFY
jgi:hypothetical protein